VFEVVNGPVPGHLAGPRGAGPIHEAAPGRALLDLPCIARVLVEDGALATVDRAPEASDADIDWLLAGPAREVARLQRGTMALRASAVVVRGRAVALLGVAAMGKSAVAAALAINGHPVLADSALPVELEGGAVARGTSDALELWPSAASQLGLDPSAGDVVRPALAKRAHRFGASEAAPLGAVALLERVMNNGDPSAERLRGRRSITTLGRFTAMLPLLEPLGLGVAHYRWLTRLATAVPVFHVKTDRHRRDLAAVAHAVEALVE
jgi:hypothetical protein